MQTYLQIYAEVSDLFLFLLSHKKRVFFPLLAKNMISCIKATNGENIQGEWIPF